MTETTNTTESTFTLTNACECAYCTDCEMGMVVEYGEPCVECESKDHMNYDIECYGSCVDDMDFLKDDIKAWQRMHRNKYVLATCKETHPLFGHPRTGYKVMKMDSDFSNMISPDTTDWSQHWTVEIKRGGTLKCVQSHHDHPTGQFITFEPLKPHERKMLDEQGYIERDDMEIYL